MSKTLEIEVRTEPRTLSRRALHALTHLERYAWIIFTSRHAVRYFLRHLRALHATMPKQPRIAAVGPVTAAALRKAQLRPDLISSRRTVDDTIRLLGRVKNQRILFPRSAIAPQAPVRKLRARGARVTIIPLYDTRAVPISRAVRSAVMSGKYTRILLKSPSGVRGIARQLRGDEKAMVLNMPAYCIGPTTAQAAKASGFKNVFITHAL